MELEERRWRRMGNQKVTVETDEAALLDVRFMIEKKIQYNGFGVNRSFSDGNLYKPVVSFKRFIANSQTIRLIFWQRVEIPREINIYRVNVRM